MQTVNHASHRTQCILCGNSDSSLYLVSRRAESHEYLRCNGCGLVFDKEAMNEGATLELSDELFKSGSQAFRKEYVEDADVSDEKGNLYPRFSYTNNASIEKDIVSRALRSLSLHGNLADRKGNIRLLEVGCATGFLCAGLKEHLRNADVTGIDPSPISIKKARQRTSEVRFEIGTLDTVEVGEEKYDAAFCIGNLMLHRNPLDTLCRIHAALKPGGIVLFDFKNLRSMPRRLAFWVYHAPLLNRSRIGRKFIGRAFGNMRYVFDRRTLQSVIGAAGFEVLEM